LLDSTIAVRKENDSMMIAAPKTNRGTYFQRLVSRLSPPP
jgi:hypothetical protein